MGSHVINTLHSVHLPQFPLVFVIGQKRGRLLVIDLQPLLQVIMLTGNTTVATAIEGMKLGAYDYLMKPTETEDLVDKITKAHALKTEHEERISKAEINNTIKRRYW